MHDDAIKFTISLLAVWLNNSVAVPLHCNYPKEEVQHRMAVVGSDSIIGKWQAPLLPIARNVSIDLDDALVLFTSGSTAKPKGVLHTFSSLSSQLGDLHASWQLSPEDKFLHCLPLNHIHGLVTGLLSALSVGASIEIHSRFDGASLWAGLGRSTVFTAVPTIYSALYQERLGQDLNRVRLMISGSSSLSPSLFDKWKGIRAQGIVERYGMTETGMIASNSIVAGQHQKGSVGRCFPSVEMKIIKDDPGESFGQIFVRGPGLFRRYLNEGAADGPVDGSGFFRTGDQGFIDEASGCLVLTGRDRDIFKVNGFKVSAVEIENALLEEGTVRECAVAGVVDGGGAHGDLVVVHIVLEEGVDAAGCDAAYYRKYLGAKLAHYKIPRRWHVGRRPLPRNMLGKVDKKQLLAGVA